MPTIRSVTFDLRPFALSGFQFTEMYLVLQRTAKSRRFRIIQPATFFHYLPQNHRAAFAAAFVFRTKLETVRTYNNVTLFKTLGSNRFVGNYKGFLNFSATYKIITG